MSNGRDTEFLKRAMLQEALTAMAVTLGRLQLVRRRFERSNVSEVADLGPQLMRAEAVIRARVQRIRLLETEIKHTF